MESNEDVGPRFERHVTPFEVRGPEGDAYDHPFLGGLSVPRPQFVDIDDDGDPDLFVQERTGEIIFFENTGTPSDAHFTWRTDRFRGLDVGEWYRFADLDDDGDFDLLAEEPYSYIRYYRNTGTPSDPSFALAVDTLRTADGTPLFSDRQNIPNVADIDCDGLADLFIGRLDGTVTRYEETDGARPVPRFRLVSDRFENIEIVSQIAQPGTRAPMPNVPGRRTPGSGPSASEEPATSGRREEGKSGRMEERTNGRGPGWYGRAHPLIHSSTHPLSETRERRALHGANTMSFADVDGDGDQDLLWGDYFEPGLLLIENTGSCQNPSFRSEPVAFPPADPIRTSGYNAPAVTDIDGDGDLDFFVGVLGGAFDPSSTARDNFYFYEQTAKGQYRLQTQRFLDGIDVGSESTPALGDLDGDGDLDLIVGNKIATDDTGTARLFVFENRGSADDPVLHFTGTLDAVPAYHYAPALGDLDGDGRPDLLLGTWNDGVAFYRNTGGEDDAPFELVDEQLVQLTRGSNTTPALGDLDGDGDLDLLVGESSGTLNYYENTGTPQAPRFELVSDEYLGLDVGRRSAPALHDLDGDGDLDLIVGRERDGLALYLNEGTPQEPDFVASGTLSAEVPALASPAFADIDGSGRHALFTGGRSGGVMYFVPSGP